MTWMNIRKFEYKNYEKLNLFVFYFVLWNGIDEFSINYVRPIQKLAHLALTNELVDLLHVGRIVST